MSNCLLTRKFALRLLHRLWILLITGILGGSFAVAQQAAPRVWNPTDTDPQYETRKLQLLPAQSASQANAVPNRNAETQATPACFEPRDQTWTELPRNDDGSFGPVALGWNFSLFGTPYNSVYINTNGNITFNAPLETYTPDGFPISTPMVAAFWGDVDTRNPASGAVYYKLYGDRLVITWDHVGYYNQKVDKLNTFQMTIKANTVSGFSGNDVIFAYDDMQWTTGDVSGGVNGFGGAPSTVGANRGNNVDFIQTGRFNINSNQPPNVPNSGDPGGVDFLDGICVGYRVGAGGNIPPAVVGLPAGNTIILDQGQTSAVSLQFSGPETNQNVSVTPNLSGLCSVTATVTNNNTPNPTVTFTATGSTCNVGTTNVTFTAVDNGTPAASQTFTITLVVNPPPEGMNTPPTVVTTIPNQTATVGQAFSYTVQPGTFTDAETPNSLALSASNLPPGLSISGGIISGVPSTTVGSPFSVTMTATDPGRLSVSISFLFTVLPGAVVPVPVPVPIPTGCGSPTATIGQPLQLLAPTYDCNGDGTIKFNVTGGNGSLIEYQSIPGISVDGQGGWNANCIQLVDDEIRTAMDAPVLVLQARQNGVVVSYRWDLRAVCPADRPGAPYENQSPGITNPIPDQTAMQDASFSYTFPANTFTDPDGDPMTYSATGLPPGLSLSGRTISGTPFISGIYPVAIRATDGSILSTTDVFVLTVSSSSTFAVDTVVTLSCNPVTSRETGRGTQIMLNPLYRGAVQLTFNPLYRGSSGQPVSFSIVNELLPTTGPGPYTIFVYPDNPTITLVSSQNDVPGEVASRFNRPITNEEYPYYPVYGTVIETRFQYNWLAACISGSPRVGAEPLVPLTVDVLGNPVLTETAEVEVRGATGQSLRLQMVDGQGRSVHELTVKEAGEVERATLRLGQSAGTYFLKVTTDNQKKVVKVVKK